MLDMLAYVSMVSTCFYVTQVLQCLPQYHSHRWSWFAGPAVCHEVPHVASWRYHPHAFVGHLVVHPLAGEQATSILPWQLLFVCWDYYSPN